MNIAKTIMSAAPAKKRSANDIHFVRDSANPIMSAPNVICMTTATAPRRFTCPKPAVPIAPHTAPRPKTARERREDLHVAPEDVLREDGQEREERERAEAPDEREADEPAQGRASAVGGLEPRLEVLEDAAARGSRRRAALQEEERDDDREEREAVEAEARRGTERRERDAREDRADDAGEVELDRVQGDRVRKVLLVDERRDERLVGGPSEGLGDADDAATGRG